jgi:hypothetical protein
MPVHRIDNLNIALKFSAQVGVPVPGITAEGNSFRRLFYIRRVLASVCALLTRRVCSRRHFQRRQEEAGDFAERVDQGLSVSCRRSVSRKIFSGNLLAPVNKVKKKNENAHSRSLRSSPQQSPSSTLLRTPHPDRCTSCCSATFLSALL